MSSFQRLVSSEPQDQRSTLTEDALKKLNISHIDVDFLPIASSAVKAEESQARRRAVGQTELAYQELRRSHAPNSPLSTNACSPIIHDSGIDEDMFGPPDIGIMQGMQAPTPMQRFAMLNPRNETFWLNSRSALAKQGVAYASDEGLNIRVAGATNVENRIKRTNPSSSMEPMSSSRSVAGARHREVQSDVEETRGITVADGERR